MQAPHDLAADVHHRGVSDLHRRGQVRRALQLARVRSGESQGGGTGVTQRMGVRLEMASMTSSLTCPIRCMKSSKRFLTCWSRGRAVHADLVSLAKRYGTGAAFRWARPSGCCRSQQESRCQLSRTRPRAQSARSDISGKAGRRCATACAAETPSASKIRVASGACTGPGANAWPASASAGSA